MPVWRHNSFVFTHFFIFAGFSFCEFFFSSYDEKLTIFLWKFIHESWEGWNCFIWKICLISSSFLAVFLWWQVLLLRLYTTNRLGIGVIAWMLLLLLINVVWCLCVVIVLRLGSLALLLVLILLGLILGELSLELENSLSFGFDLGSDFLMEFNLSIVKDEKLQFPIPIFISFFSFL